MIRLLGLLILWLALPLTAAQMTSINIIDRNGLSQTISSKNRLAEFEKIDFFQPQPYQKVLRVLNREKNGDVRALVTTYHPNGQVKQYLEVTNNRAFGRYWEWFPSGAIKVQARVIGGIADLSPQAEQSYLFDGISYAWDDEGHLVAYIPYEKGELMGTAYFYHPNSYLWKETPYYKGVLHGTQRIYREEGTLLQITSYHLGEKEGMAYRYWESGDLAAQEEYHEGKLLQAAYYSPDQHLLGEIVSGTGTRIVFGKTTICQTEEYHQGVQEGRVRLFNDQDLLVASITFKGGLKHGEEMEYYPHLQQPRLLLSWQNGQLHGVVKTWFENGQLESQREMGENQKNGLLMSWYQDGALMLVEEYENDRLLKGEYYRPHDPLPCSYVEQGQGTATLFDPDGTFLKRIEYRLGWPLE